MSLHRFKKNVIENDRKLRDLAKDIHFRNVELEANEGLENEKEETSEELRINEEVEAERDGLTLNVELK